VAKKTIPLKIKKIQYFILTKSIGFYINSLGILFPKKAAQLAYKLFSQPRIGKLNPLAIPDFLASANLKTIDYKHHKIQTYTWQGNDNIILLVHGWESNTTRWKKLFPYLQKTGSTIVAIDAPAHGLSNGSEFNAILYSEFVKTAVDTFQPDAIIGHSVGGMSSYYYQYKHRNLKIKKLVLLGAPSDLRVIFSNYVQLLSLNLSMKNALENYFIAKFQLQLNDFSGEIFCQHIPTKAIIAHDEKDKIVSYSEAQKLAKVYKNAKFITTKGFGHSLHNEELYQEIADFLLEVFQEQLN
jgi:pimeloyl-ACP methyl ester carboxylesterase